MTPEIRNCFRPGNTLLLALALAASVAASPAAAQESRPTSRPAASNARPASTNVVRDSQEDLARQGLLGDAAIGEEPQPGELAPDFALTPIKFYDFKTRHTEITENNAGVLYEPVHLSSFRSEKPVALIFGSYT